MIKQLMLLAALAAPTPVLAWGAEGHEIVAQIALAELTPAARAQVATLLGSDAMMVHDANWADEVRNQRPETGPWHFVDIPLNAPGFDAARDCVGGQCAIGAIQSARNTLRDPKASTPARQASLRFLIHLVGDIHQPLHAEDNQDKGGNAVHVTQDGQGTNLHHMWDTEVVNALGQNEEAAAAELERAITPEQRKAWSTGTPVDWVNEFHAIARDTIYPRFHDRIRVRVPSDYIYEMAPVTRAQLSKGGVRLAYLLNETLK